MTEKDKEAPYGRYASGNPRPKPVKKKSGNIIWRAIHRWWLKAIEKWRKGEVLVEKPTSMRRRLRANRVGVEGHAKSSLARGRKAPASIHTTIVYPMQLDRSGNLLTHPAWSGPCPFSGCGCSGKG